MIMHTLSRTMKIPVMIDARPSLPPVPARAANSLSSCILILENNSPSSLELACLNRSCTLVGESPIPLDKQSHRNFVIPPTVSMKRVILSFMAWVVLENITASPQRGNCFSRPLSCSWSSSRLFADERTRQALLVLSFHYSVDGNSFVNWSSASRCNSLVDRRYTDVAVQAGQT